ncbi:hypothetical protein OG225_36890 [Nocardia sp. NBC_01377]|uniref:hypothetical protein n=1 Tax=Nocardia sp. NBC_01377 TaxID=2903595 RepID=UPI003255A8EC
MSFKKSCARIFAAVSAAMAVGLIATPQTASAEVFVGGVYYCNDSVTVGVNRSVAYIGCIATGGAPAQGRVDRFYVSLAGHLPPEILLEFCESGIAKIGVPDNRFDLVGSQCGGRWFTGIGGPR